ncbi:hypothetical protein [Spirosoma jeollabukense]
MKPFDGTLIFTRLAPLLNLIIPDIPLRPFFSRLIIAFLTTQTIGALVTLGQSMLGSPSDDTWQYYLFLALEMIQYGCWFWNVWYGIRLLFTWVIPLDAKGILTADSVGLAISLGFLLFMVNAVSSLQDQTYSFTIRLVLIAAFTISIALPMIWKKAT